MTQLYYLNSPNGAMYSADHHINRFLPENAVKFRPETKIPNLTQGGQDIYCAGVSSAMMTGLLAASHTLGRNLLKEAENLDKFSNWKATENN